MAQCHVTLKKQVIFNHLIYEINPAHSVLNQQTKLGGSSLILFNFFSQKQKNFENDKMGRLS